MNRIINEKASGTNGMEIYYTEEMPATLVMHQAAF